MRRPLTVVPLLVLALLAGCAATPVPPPTPTSTPAPVTPSSPAPQALVVAPGERPPTVMDGDCLAALTPEELSQTIGEPVTRVFRRDERWTRSLNGVGGLSCEWEGEAVRGGFEILPRAGLGSAEFTPDQDELYFQECNPDWVCAWQWETEGLRIVGSFQGLRAMTRERVDSLGDQLGSKIAARADAYGQPTWQLDRSRWWSAPDCAQLAASVGTLLGAELTGTWLGHHDTPSAGTALADTAVAYRMCLLDDAATAANRLILSSTAGLGWDVPWAGEGAPVDTGAHAVEAYARPGGGYIAGTMFELTDGVNVLSAEVAGDAPWSSAEVLGALGSLVANGL
ncbi:MULTISPECIES: hypothetical protein [unclassified Microbacterium]|uniref:hypothetical protein n=1 Tax=unclassified Microbacterium TaxID=2609290 RepID=UPI00214A907A|nr:MULTISPECIES: hypothetical protein [unclassified Microbacterium]MCR2808765.1 hypothetical protein [Microbacterium sp. zg.B185]WIM18808.1 hypothetical protein QNO12_14650 [Microbacterium sp. zg-B185]